MSNINYLFDPLDYAPISVQLVSLSDKAAAYAAHLREQGEQVTDKEVLNYLRKRSQSILSESLIDAHCNLRRAIIAAIEIEDTKDMLNLTKAMSLVSKLSGQES